MIIAGTIRNSVSLAALDSKWQQKKQDISKGSKENLTAEERVLQRFQEQADSIRESRKPADIDAKLQAGGKLTAEEIEYLKKNDPEALKEYEEVQRERESYKKQLKNCKSKEEVEKLKMTKMGHYMTEAKEITNDPYIPKAQKYKLMKKMLKKTSAVETEQEKFLQSLKYAKLPEEEKEARKKEHIGDEAQQEEKEDKIMAISGIGSSYNQIGAATNHVQEKTAGRDAGRKTAEQPVSISISNEGKEHYRNSIQQNGHDSYDAVLQRREQLKNEKLSLVDYGYEISRRAAQANNGTTDAGKSILGTADKADGYVRAYAEMYDEIVQGYEDGTREIYVAGENGPRKLTKEEELDALDAAYRKSVDRFVTLEQTNRHARQIIAEEAEKISKISRRTTSAANFLKEQKARETDKVPENLNEKMLSAVASFKEKYAAFNPNAGTLAQLLAGIKISQ